MLASYGYFILVALLLASFTVGFGWGRRYGRREGVLEGELQAPLHLRQRGLEKGRCVICGSRVTSYRKSKRGKISGLQ
ncbi:hypothetical protein [Calderihabitans maritimus]|uniref:Uncharacterized protein n=1 Tax=Calderihabitans maritimus TaxID=1246530 RepID=A0A1Z5HQ88_9FIRM|nr:hypothetical protein [Calderihabitans maritimus]GAW91481.1 hypothetical protein Halha_0972 [Calderihabitans maritimus]